MKKNLIKIEIKSRTGRVIFRHEAEDNTILQTLYEAIKSGTDLRGVDLTGTNLRGANLTGTNLRCANLTGTDLRGVDLTGTNLRGVNLTGTNLRCANLTGTNLRGVDLTGTNLRGVDLSGTNLRCANLTGTNLRGVDLTGADLRGTNLRCANLTGTDLRGVDLTGADLRGAILTGTNLRGVDLTGVDLTGADLSNAIDIDKTERWYQCCQNILFVLSYLKKEIPHLKEKIIAGEINGSQYEGECCCLIGTLGNEKACNIIPYYNKGTHNLGEQFFLSIKVGDTPENNIFSKKAFELCNEALKR